MASIIVLLIGLTQSTAPVTRFASGKSANFMLCCQFFRLWRKLTAKDRFVPRCRRRILGFG